MNSASAELLSASIIPEFSISVDPPYIKVLELQPKLSYTRERLLRKLFKYFCVSYFEKKKQLAARSLLYWGVNLCS